MSQPASTEIRPTPTIEDYLAIMYVMERDGEQIIAARLAESLNVTPPTVTVTLKRMERDGWIEVDQQKNVHLTEPLLCCQLGDSPTYAHRMDAGSGLF